MATPPTGSSYILETELARFEQRLTRMVYLLPLSQLWTRSFIRLLPRRAMAVDLLGVISRIPDYLPHGERWA